jgi:hypothetical protein
MGGLLLPLLDEGRSGMAAESVAGRLSTVGYEIGIFVSVDGLG